MTTQRYLNQIHRFDWMIQNKLAEIYKLKTMASSITVATDKENVKSSGSKDKLGDTVSKIVDLETETDLIIDSYIIHKKRIVEQIDNIEDDRYYNILSMKYVGNSNIREIAESMCMSRRRCEQLHDKALKLFEEMYGKEYMG